MCLFLPLHFWLLSLSLTISKWKASLSFLPSFYLHQQRTMARSTSLQIAAVTLLFHEWCTVNGVVLHVALCSPVASDTNNNEVKEPWIFLFFVFWTQQGLKFNWLQILLFHSQNIFFFLNKKEHLMCFIHATVVVTWETIRMCVSVSDDNVCVRTHCPSCIDLKASWSFLLSVRILAIFSFSFFSNLYRQQQVSCIMAEQVARKWKGDSPLWPQTSLQINKLQRDNYARGKQVFQELKSADIFGLNGKKNLCPR